MQIPIKLHASLKLGASLTLLLIAGCASNNPWDNYHFGDAVRHQIAIQTASPGASAYGLDGVKAAGALSAYQKDQGDPKSVKTFDLVTTKTPEVP